ncbi:MAG: S41 family peptidase [Verrucomicrobiota bacterium]
MRWILLFLIPEFAFATPPASTADGLSQGQIQNAFRALRQDYIEEDELSFLEINRAALAGILESLGQNAQLITESPPKTPADTPAVESFAPLAGYFRPIGFQIQELESFDKALEDFTADGASTLVLDLRYPNQAPEFADCLQFLNRFLPENTMAFKIGRDGNTFEEFATQPAPHSWEGEIILLVDSDTSPGAEVVAHCLIHHLAGRVLTLGSPTMGNAAEYSIVPLSDDVQLRFASSSLYLADGTRLFRRPVTPEIHVSVFPAIKRGVFAQSREIGLKPFIEDIERSFLNEAALVAGTNPELALKIQNKSSEAESIEVQPLQDRCLQLALDFARIRSALKAPSD